MSGPTATEKEENGSGRYACLLTLPESLETREPASIQSVAIASNFKRGPPPPSVSVCCANANAVAAMEIKYL